MAYLRSMINSGLHTYFFDYQTGKAKYVESILTGLNWDVLSNRFKQVGAQL